jgi:hypothetical protein
MSVLLVQTPPGGMVQNTAPSGRMKATPKAREMALVRMSIEARGQAATPLPGVGPPASLH